MESNKKDNKKQGGRKKIQLYKPRKKKSVEEDAAIQYLQAQYEKVCNIFNKLPVIFMSIFNLKLFQHAPITFYLFN